MGKDTGEVEDNSSKLPVYMEFKPAENTRDWAGVVQNILPMRARVAQPELMKPLEDLYLALRARFPDVETLEEFGEFERRNQIEAPMNSSG